MSKVIRRTVIRRFLEFFFWEVVLSVVVTALTTAEGNTSKRALVGITVIGIFVYVLINVLFQRRCCMDLADKRMYYKTNFIAYFMFIAVNMLCVFTFGNIQYTWAFALTKAVRYLYVVIPTSVSALMFHALMLLAIYYSPYGMDKLLMVVSDGRNLESYIRRHERERETHDEDGEEEALFNIPEERRRKID